MKKIIYVLLTVALVLSFASCQNETVVKQLPDYVSNDAFDKAAAIIEDILGLRTKNITVDKLEVKDSGVVYGAIKNFEAKKVDDSMEVKFDFDHYGTDNDLDDVEAKFNISEGYFNYSVSYLSEIKSNGYNLDVNDQYDLVNINYILQILDDSNLDSRRYKPTYNASVRTYTLNEDIYSEAGYGRIAKGSKLILTQTKRIADEKGVSDGLDYDLTIEITSVINKKSYTVSVSTLSDFIVINGVTYRYENSMFPYLIKEYD